MFSKVVIFGGILSLSVLVIDVLVVMFVGTFVQMFVATFRGMTNPWFGGLGCWISIAGPGSSLCTSSPSCSPRVSAVSLLHLHY